MKCSSQEFSELIKSAADVCGKPITEGAVKFYWFNLRHVESNDLTKAFGVFGAKGKWPTVNEILEECGYQPHQTRKEQYANSRDDTPDSEQVPERQPSEESGEWTWEHRVECSSLTQAETIFAKCKAKLTSNGWTICNENTFECRSQPTPKSPMKTVFKRQWHAIKPVAGNSVWGNR